MPNSSNIRLNERYDIEALIGSPPSWTLRWGLTALLAVLLLILGISHLVSYPDLVTARTLITTENPPIRLAAGATAKLDKLNVENGQQVKQGDLLAVLDNPANLPDVLLLDSLMQLMDGEEEAAYFEVRMPSSLDVGSLQDNYAAFLQKHKDLRYYLSQDVNFLKINNLRNQIEDMYILNKSLFRQEKILAEEVQLARRNVERDSALLSTNSISKLEFEKSQGDWLARRRELEALRAGTSNNNLRIRQMEAQIIDLKQAQSDGESQRLLDFRSEVLKLKGELDAWKQTYLLVAPVSGEVALTKAWSEQQQVESGAEVLTIVPTEGAGKVIAKAVLTGSRSGIVKEKMPVNIRLDAFPFQEFGVLNGEVQRIAAVPGENGYEIEISIPADLRTSYGKILPFRQEMQGTARIITEKKSLLERVFDRILSAFSSN